MARLEGGVLGRSDDMLVIRGNNVYPSAVEAILREFPEVAEFRISVGSSDRPGDLASLQLEIEPASGTASNQLGERVTNAFRDRLNFRPEVTIVGPGSLPRFEMKAKRIVRRA